ncbi:MAG: hypothetical protein L0K82_05045 [Pisciglobus halotolerans]|nr:hypothetical protein [Pisciglobus halotolerans]
MKKTKNWVYSILVLIVVLFGGYLFSDDESTNLDHSEQEIQQEKEVLKGKYYFKKDEVAQYLHEYGMLPPNYLTKKEAQAKGWNDAEGNLWKVTKQSVIGGDYFGNFEGKLPKKKGRRYFEADVNYEGGYRGSERLIYSNDELLFFTPDHYKTFVQLY